MKLLFLFNFLFLLTLGAAFCQEVTTRSEIEGKLYFEMSRDLQTDLSEKIQVLLKQNLAQFNFEKKIGPCKVDKTIKVIYFEDRYFDTFKDDLFKNNAIYRIRSRFKPYLKWLIHKKIGFFKLLDPHRVEVQFKNNYEELKPYTSKVNETRFEVNISEEFSYDDIMKLPQPFGQPVFKEKVEVVSLKRRLKPIYTSLTKRQRFHVNCQNPWGSGNNPTQVFLISVDRVIYLESHISEVKLSSRGIEIEVELERNISSRLEEYSMMDNPKNDPTLIIAKNYSAKVYKLLREDLTVINSSIHELILKNFNERPMSMKSKYRRIREKIIGE